MQICLKYPKYMLIIIFSEWSKSLFKLNLCGYEHMNLHKDQYDHKDHTENLLKNFSR